MTSEPALILEGPHHSAKRCPERPALVTDTGTMNYAALAAAIHRSTTELRGMGAAGDRIAIVGDNSVDYVIALYAVPLAGRVLAMVNQRLHPTEQAELLRRVEANAVVGDRERLDRLTAMDAASDELAWLPFSHATHAIAPDDPASTTDVDPFSIDGDTAAWLIHTSGTTGPAKGVPVTHGNLRASVAAGHRGRPVQDGDVYYYPFPLCHIAAYNVVLQHQHGATVVLPGGFEAGAALRAIAVHGVTTMSLAPTMIVRLLEHPSLDDTDLSALRSIGYGAAPLPTDVRRRAEERLGCRLVEGYGMTELAGNAAFDGVPDPAIALRTVDDRGAPTPAGTSGEIVARGPQVISQYWDNPSATAEAFRNGWFHTGDIGVFDPAGRLSVIDRKKDIIITGGENVGSREVEDVVAAVPGVAEVAVVGLPDTEWGERITAVVVPQSSAEPDALRRAIDEHVRARLAGFKVPRQIDLVAELPVNDNGKVDKVALRATASERRPDDGFHPPAA